MEEAGETFREDASCALEGIGLGKCPAHKKKSDHRSFITERLLPPVNRILRDKRQKLVRNGDKLCRNHRNFLEKELVTEKRMKNAQENDILEVESAGLETPRKEYQQAQIRKIIDDDGRFHFYCVEDDK